jgi:hypothetical protein
MQNKRNKTKKYGQPYADKIYLKHGDIKKIASETGYAYISVVHQLNGERKISPIVAAASEKYVQVTKALMLEVSKNN